MDYQPRSEKVQNQIAHFSELITGMERYLRTRGFPEGFTKSQMRETTPQYMEMELMLRMWIRDEIILAGNKGLKDKDLRKLLNERTQSMFDKEFSDLPARMRGEGELSHLLIAADDLLAPEPTWYIRPRPRTNGIPRA